MLHVCRLFHAFGAFLSKITAKSEISFNETQAEYYERTGW